MEPTSFTELGLSAKVLQAIDASGYTTPTPIQAGAIPVAVAGQDVLGIAQTGTGKTAAFVLPLLSRLEKGRARARMPRCLILAPTRELAAQVSQAFETYGTNHKFTMALLIGGVSFVEQLKKLDRGVDVLIATPGRLMDHFGRGKLLLTGVEILVIDEADRMLDMGFIPDIEKICKLLPPRRQTLFFSATMPKEITRLAGQFLTDPARVEVAPPATTAKTITQRFRYLPDDTDWVKREILREMIDEQDNLQNAIIFCNRKRDVAILLKSLQKHGYNAGALHGDMDQTARMATLAAFRAGEITILAASDVAARGLDIPEVSHVFNYDMPWQTDDYVHRVGRTGRAGREGYAAALVSANDIKVVKELEKAAGEPTQWIGDPPGDDAQALAKTKGRGRGSNRSTTTARGTGQRSGVGGARTNNRGSGRSSRTPGASEEATKELSTSDRSRRSRRGRGPQSGNEAATSNTQSSQDNQLSDRATITGAETEQTTAAQGDTTAVDTTATNEGPTRARRSRRRQPRRRDLSATQEKQAVKTITSSSSDHATTETKAKSADHAGPAQPTALAKDKSTRNDDRRTERRGSNKSRQSADGKGDKVLGDARGLGDNVPAFLKRPVRTASE